MTVKGGANVDLIGREGAAQGDLAKSGVRSAEGASGVSAPPGSGNERSKAFWRNARASSGVSRVEPKCAARIAEQRCFWFPSRLLGDPG